MDTSRRIYVTVAIIALAALLVSLIGYFGAYVLAAETVIDETSVVRIYRRSWQAEFFEPAARAEEILTRKAVVTTSWTE
jgi:hypothetical protein